MNGKRDSIAAPVELIKDLELKAQWEAENGVLQFKLAVQIILANIPNDDNSFKLRQWIILKLHEESLDGIHPPAGTYRNSRVFTNNSNHLPPKSIEVADHVADMCEYINANWENKNPCQLSSHVLWKLNWIHPFSDGNGRTARVVSYVILNIKLRSLLPVSPTIPDLIASDKAPYYAELEKADREWLLEKLDIFGMEQMMEGLLARQLPTATKEAGY